MRTFAVRQVQNGGVRQVAFSCRARRGPSEVVLLIRHPSSGPVKQRLAGGESVQGTMFLAFNAAVVTHVVDAAGADFAIMDLEHAAWELSDLHPILEAGRHAAAEFVVRVPSHGFPTLGRALDLGAKGIMVPMVEDALQANEIVRAVKYPPAGRRGYGSLVEEDEGLAHALSRANEETLVIAQVETARGLENVEDIAATPGVDVVWIGHFDLTISMGIPGAFTDPKFVRAVERIVAATEAAGSCAGVLVGSVDEAERAQDQGFRCIAFGADLDLLHSALSERLTALRTRHQT